MENVAESSHRFRLDVKRNGNIPKSRLKTLPPPRKILIVGLPNDYFNIGNAVLPEKLNEIIQNRLFLHAQKRLWRFKRYRIQPGSFPACNYDSFFRGFCSHVSLPNNSQKGR